MRGVLLDLFDAEGPAGRAARQLSHQEGGRAAEGRASPGGIHG